MNILELKLIKPDELSKKLTELQKNQFDLRMAKGNGQLPKSHIFKEVRRDIAKVKTLIRQNEIEKNAGNK